MVMEYEAVSFIATKVASRPSPVGATGRSVPALCDHGNPVAPAEADHLQLRARRHEHRGRSQQSPADAQRPLRDRRLEAQFAKAASAWQKMANVNFTLVSDNGSALGVSGNLQSDSRFGDIRIGGYAMTGNILAFAYLPPPANGGTSAGDIFFNTTLSWQINGTTYDLMTVAIHEFGHALGMGHSAPQHGGHVAVVHRHQAGVTTDDTSGIRTIYNSRQNDFFDANGTNDAVSAADNISSYIDSNGS